MNATHIVCQKRAAIKDACIKHGAADVHLLRSAPGALTADNETNIELLVRFVEPKAGLAYFSAIRQITLELEELLGRTVELVDDNVLSLAAPCVLVHLTVL